MFKLQFSRINKKIAGRQILNHRDLQVRQGEFTSIWQIGAQELSRVFAGEVTVKETADAIQKKLDPLMKDGGYY